MKPPLPVTWFGARALLVHRAGKEPERCHLPNLILVDDAFRADLAEARKRAEELRYLLGLDTP